MSSLTSERDRRMRCTLYPPRLLFPLVVIAATLSGCVSLPASRVKGAPVPAAVSAPATPPTITPRPAAEDRKGQEILGRLAELRSGQPYQIGDVRVVAQAPYFAASGRLCRRLVLVAGKDVPPTRRVACRQGDHWRFSADIFAGR